MVNNESIKIVGDFHLQVFENESLKEVFHAPNLVVTLGHQNMARLISGHASGKKIDQIAIGTNVAAPDISDTTITGAFTKALGASTYPDPQSVMFTFDIDNSEANGMTIREFGLLNTDNVLCARKVRTGEIIKTSAIRLVGTWKITFS